MNPQMTYMLAVDHARDLRHDAERRMDASTTSTPSDRSRSSIQAPRTPGRFLAFRSRLRLA